MQLTALLFCGWHTSVTIFQDQAEDLKIKLLPYMRLLSWHRFRMEDAGCGSILLINNQKSNVMKMQFSAAEIISELHQKGYDNDFQIRGDDLLWVQEGVFIRMGKFVIDEFRKVTDARNKVCGMIVFSVHAPYYNIKGILISHYKAEKGAMPSAIKNETGETACCS